MSLAFRFIHRCCNYYCWLCCGENRANRPPDLCAWSSSMNVLDESVDSTTFSEVPPSSVHTSLSRVLFTSPESCEICCKLGSGLKSSSCVLFVWWRMAWRAAWSLSCFWIYWHSSECSGYPIITLFYRTIIMITMIIQLITEQKIHSTKLGWSFILIVIIHVGDYMCLPTWSEGLSGSYSSQTSHTSRLIQRWLIKYWFEVKQKIDVFSISIGRVFFLPS